MEQLKHIMTFEQYSVNETGEVNEGLKDLFKSLKTKIDEFLTDPKDDKKANDLIGNAFSSTFSKKGGSEYKSSVLSEPLETKVNILTQASEKLSDSKIGVLKLFKNSKGEYTVGGVGVIGGTGGGMKS